MKQFVGTEMNVLESMGNYTIRTLDDKVVVSSACKPTSRFYCSPEKLAPHIGHSIICIGSPSDEEKFDNISIWCEDCEEILFSMDSDEPGAPEPDDYGYEEPDGEEEES